ncbi:MAG: hypothetical protein RIB93_09995 [Coleofasciculus sp. D1-CHI-01]|uniref:hypothetical protein n=1 Tax=Coleofasciculus sp. D1-CHI-01 TaxID=3068482 RepID=UPI0033046218
MIFPPLSPPLETLVVMSLSPQSRISAAVILMAPPADCSVAVRILLSVAMSLSVIVRVI